jgi:succinyl-CoA synthetase beta subunit
MDPASLITEARKQGRAALDEMAGKQLLAAYGVAVPRSVIVTGAADVDTAFRQLKAPVVIKVMSPDILHKSDAGGVKVGIGSADEASAAIREMMANPAIGASRIDGFLIEEMAPGGQEMVIGGLRDPHFGPLVMVGLGGIFVEVLADVTFRICPIERRDAEEMLDELKGAVVLKGARGRKPVSREAIVAALLRIGGEGGLLMDLAADIQEADINPLIVSDAGAVAVDARFLLTRSKTT